MARGRIKSRPDPYAKKAHETDLQWRSRIAHMRQMERDRNEPKVTPEAAKHGDYRPDFVMHVETGTKTSTMINRGGTSVDRWIASGKLSQAQQTVIGMCVRLWRLAGLRQAVTANYGQVVGGSSCYELRAMTEIEAREDLHRLQGYFPGSLKGYWDVFENICRHGIAAGVAGASAGYTNRSAQDRAHTIVCFVTDVIATREGI